MPWKRFWKRADRDDEPAPTSATTAAPAADGNAQRRLPPHLARLAGRERPPAPAGPAGDDRARRLRSLEQRRNGMLYEVRQGEQAEAEDNAWTQRIDLLTEALATISDDLTRLDAAPKRPYHPVPPTPVSIERVDAGDTARVSLRVGDQRFDYSDDPDWAERGHQITRTELVRRSGDPSRLVPDDTPEELRAALERHLSDSLFVLATDLRDRRLDDEPFPDRIVLSDLARSCPACGGWMDWRGTCQACAQRAAAAAELRREQTRLLDERAAAAEERHRLIERLPLARRRLRDVEVEIAALSDDP